MPCEIDVPRDLHGYPVRSPKLTDRQSICAGMARGTKIKGKRGKDMSERLLKNLEELLDSIDRNTPSPEDRLGKSDAVVISAAKYRKALERLAGE